MSIDRQKKNSGFTLIELLLAVFILSTGIVGTLSFFVNAMQSTEYARNMTVATSHAEYILEEMQTLESLSDVKNRDWAVWAKQQGLITLPNETVRVDITNSLHNLLDIQATVSWTKNLRVNKIVLKTQLTR